MNHAVVTDMLDGNARRGQPAGIGVALVAHRIEFGGVDDGGGQSGQMRRSQRRNPDIGGVCPVRQIIRQIRIEHGLVDQMIFREGLTRG